MCVIIKQVCSATTKILTPRYIRIPAGDSLQEVVHGFEHKWGFPQCAGAIDGTHIPIIA